MIHDIELWHYITANAIVFIGALLQGSIGIGLSILAAPLLMVIQPAFVPVPLIMMGTIFSLFIAIRNRHDASTHRAAAALTGNLPGSIIAGFIIWYLPLDVLTIVFAIVIIVAVGISLTGWGVTATSINCILIGFVAGLMGTITSLAGPPIALLFQKERGPAVRGTISLIYLFGGIVAIGVNFFTGRVDMRQLFYFLTMLPGLAAGLLLSKPLAGVLDRGFIRPGILILSLFASVTVLLRYL